jgi:hypothetical protein
VAEDARLWGRWEKQLKKSTDQGMPAGWCILNHARCYVSLHSPLSGNIHEIYFSGDSAEWLEKFSHLRNFTNGTS